MDSFLKTRLNLALEMRLKGFENITPHLIGPPGVGKTTFVREWAIEKAREFNLEFVDADQILPEEVEYYLQSPDKYYIFKDCRLTGMDPIDISGQPRPYSNSKFITYLPLSIARLLHSCAGLLVLEEFLNETRETMIASSYKIVRDYKIGDIALNKRVLVVAVSNSAQYSSLVGSIPKPLRDRFDFIEVPGFSVEEWVEWMDKTYGAENWECEVLAYLMWKPSDFLANVTDNLSNDNGYEPPATPRGWSYVALAFKLLKSKNTRNKDFFRSVAVGKLGNVGETLMAFLSNKVPSFQELVKNPAVIVNFNIEQKYLAALTIAENINANAKNVPLVKKFLESVSTKDDREFVSAFFTFLKKERRLLVYNLVKDNPVVFKCLEATGRALSPV
ncbi:MAG: hypothetical protein QXR63_00060 [Candidatus Bathyarchaeia archaeon]